MSTKFPTYRQLDKMDCGPTCLRMIAKHFGVTVPIQKLRTLSETTREGSSLKGLSNTAEHLGFRSLGIRTSFEVLEDEVPLPTIAHWNKSHFVVVHKIKNEQVHVADPGLGLKQYSKEDFIEGWIGNNATEHTKEGILLALEPTPNLMKNDFEEEDENQPKGFSFLFQYLFRYKKFLTQLILGLIVASLFQLIFPFLTQSIVDIGIQNRDINFVYLILGAQLFMFIGKTGVEAIRSWILLHLGTRIKVSLVSDFFIKLMKLPISYFDVKMTGDIMQRINDHQRLESLLTSTSLNVLFSLFNLVIFGVVLAYYSLQIFGVFLLGSVLYFLWVILFLKKRKEIDNKRFAQMSTEQSVVMELINGMQEIKLNNAEKQKRWGWEYIQAKLFKINVKSMALEQKQSIGSSFINELKNIIITILSATLVINGHITLGMMLSINYIIGQLNGPINQLIGFLNILQDAKISLERLSEIHNRKEEEHIEEKKIQRIALNQNISLSNVAFRYKGALEPVLQDIHLTIPSNKVTAIVGASGSGKTTLMKMLLKFYDPVDGEIKIGEQNLKNISQSAWRSHCGVVMQEGFIFNDTIAHNIAVGEEIIDEDRLEYAVKISNIKEFIESLPLAYNTKIGLEGVGLSGGQKQRLLIARAVYKNPKFLFFDEATSSLDANNERIIMNNLNNFFKDRTALVIAHRLSTVKNADQIIVLDQGKVVEIGHHESLVSQKGAYYNLVKNQLDLERLNKIENRNQHTSEAE